MTPTAPGSTGVSVPAPAPAPTPVEAPAGCPVVIAGTVRIPAGITDLDAFRRWALSDCPEKLHVAYLNGEIWVDPSMEQWHTHNQVKGEVNTVLGSLLKQTAQGRYTPDGMLLSNTAVNLSTIPDGLFASYDTLRAGRLRRLPSAHAGGVVQLEGTPDMVLEVVSESSVEKDTITLPPLYQAAGVAEFWRVDARHELRFEIFRLTAAGYAPTQLPDGWWHSDVFARDFQLNQATDVLGDPLFTLQMRQPPAP
jgi:Uma2 family endonuclease